MGSGCCRVGLVLKLSYRNVRGRALSCSARRPSQAVEGADCCMTRPDLNQLEGADW